MGKKKIINNMEISIILNVVFLSLVAIGFIIYQVWLGSRVVKLKRENNDLVNNIDDIYRNMDVRIDEVMKVTDRLDSRMDNNITKLEERICTDIHQVEIYINNRCTELEKQSEDIDKKLKKSISNSESISNDVNNLRKNK